MTGTVTDRCPCGRPVPLDRCCGRYLAGAAAPTAEALMRSRYTAFVVGDVPHLERTWHPSTRPGRIRIDPEREWTGLEVLAAERGGMLDQDGTVEFRAHHRTPADGARIHHEVSRFVRVDGRWAYVDGD